MRTRAFLTIFALLMTLYGSVLSAAPRPVAPKPLEVLGLIDGNPEQLLLRSDQVLVALYSRTAAPSCG